MVCLLICKCCSLNVKRESIGSYEAYDGAKDAAAEEEVEHAAKKPIKI